MALEHERQAMALAVRFGGLLDAAPDAMVVVGGDGRILMANTHALTLFGYEAHALIGQPVETLVPERLRGVHFDEWRQFGTDPQARPMARLDLQGHRQDGSEFWMEISLSPLDVEEGRLIIASIRDSSEHRKLEAKFRGLLDAAPDAMIVADRDGRMLLVNSETERLFGHQREELIGQPIDILVPSRFAGGHPSHRARYVQAPHRRPMGAGLDLRGRRKDGTEFPVEISLSPLETEDGLLITSAVRETTDRTRLEGALRQGQKMEAIGQLAGGVAHDFNNMLTAILGYSELLTEQIGPDKAIGRDLREITAAAQRAATLINPTAVGLQPQASLRAGGAGPLAHRSRSGGDAASRDRGTDRRQDGPRGRPRSGDGGCHAVGTGRDESGPKCARRHASGWRADD